ncbi:MAG: tRNA (guanosine(37)-N1)-methyltransferase TrmD [Candidatus Omnitrophota bacterium]
MRVDILTLFPKMFESVLGESMLKRAQGKGAISIKIHDLRDWTFDNHRSSDDKPFGGGPGMVMKVEPVYLALKDITGAKSGGKTKVILLTPQGKRLDQETVKSLSKEEALVLVCGHYEGIDERIRSFADEEISVGDYILTCGEIPAMALIDSVARLLPGVLGSKDSTAEESFEDGLLEYPQYTRPADFKGMKVPDILLSGDHKKIERWRRKEAVNRTRLRRPDLLKKKG